MCDGRNNSPKISILFLDFIAAQAALAFWEEQRAEPILIKQLTEYLSKKGCGWRIWKSSNN